MQVAGSGGNVADMERITISVDADLAHEFDELIARRGYQNRSEAVRDILRSHVEAQRQVFERAGHCVAALSYVYNHHERELAERLAELQHAHHDLTVATTHAHLDHEGCLEVALLKGSSLAVRQFAESLIAERGIRHGQLNLISVERGEAHSHGGDSHTHLRPRS